ncbi:hypothetical protein ACFXOJ_41555, partial [Streptomyces vinaceus]
MTWDITGMASVANIGASPEEIFAALCAGQESREPLKAFDPDKYRAGYAYEIDDRPGGGGDLPRRATRWLTTVVRQAAADAGLGEDLSQVPVLVGTTMREQRSLELWWRDGADVALVASFTSTDSVCSWVPAAFIDHRHSGCSREITA